MFRRVKIASLVARARIGARSAGVSLPGARIRKPGSDRACRLSARANGDQCVTVTNERVVAVHGLLCRTMRDMTKALIPGQSAPIQFEHEFVDGLKSIFEEKIVFNQLLGLKITLLMRDRVTARFDLRRELIGH